MKEGEEAFSHLIMSILTSSSKYLNVRDLELENKKIKLVCFPYAGAGASVYYPWRTMSNLNILPIQLPGRESRISEKPLSDMESIVKKIAQDIKALLGDCEFVFFGHSMGALIAFEVTRYLKKNNEVLPKQLLLSGCPHPQDLAIKEIHKLPENEFIKELKKRNGTPQEVLDNKELMSIMIPYIKADFKLCETYIYEEKGKIDVPITIFCGKDDPFIIREDLFKWKEETNQRVEVELFEGDHFYFKKDKGEILLSSILKKVKN